MTLNDAKQLIELILPSVKQIAESAMDRVSEAVTDALAESNRKSQEQIGQLSARIAALEENRE